MSPPSDDDPGRTDPESGARVPEGWGQAAPSSDEREEPLQKAPRQYFIPADVGAPQRPETGEPGGGRPGHIPPPPGGPPPAVHPRRPSPRTDKRRVSPWRIATIALLVLVALVLVFVLYGLWQFQRMDRVAVGSVLSPGSSSGTNYLIVGSDSREGFDPNDPTAGAVLGDDTANDPTERSDTMLVLRVAGDGARMMSIPRDLWVTRPDGSQGRINASYRDGPASLIQTVQGLGIPVHHYVEVDFVTFAGLVDAVGGVTLEIPHPARDDRSGLNLPEAGAVTLDGSQSLAYVRSRRYTELIDGSWRTDPTADLGRVVRQQQFLRAVMSEVGATRNPIQLMRISGALAGGLRVDDSMGFFDALGFARRLRGLEPVSVELPVFGFTTSGGASVLGLVEPQAAEVIASFR